MYKIHKNSLKNLLEYNKNKRLKIEGQIFGRLKAIKFIKIKNSRSYWLFKCQCGKLVIRNPQHVKIGYTRSCGCLRKENTSKMWSTHKMSKERFYKIWHGILKRCNNPNDKSYAIYGGKGIKCLWKNFEEFKKDMNNSYLFHIKKYGEKDTTIDRINNNENYCKKNCKWSTKKEQARNCITNHFILYRGRKQTLSAWAEELKIGHTTILWRLKNGWTIEKSLSIKPKRGNNQYEI